MAMIDQMLADYQTRWNGLPVAVRKKLSEPVRKTQLIGMIEAAVGATPDQAAEIYRKVVEGL